MSQALKEIGLKKSFKYILGLFQLTVLKIVLLPPNVRRMLLNLYGADVGIETLIHPITFINIYRRGFKGLACGRYCFVGEECLLDLADGTRLTPIPIETRILRTPVPPELAGTPLAFLVESTPTPTQMLAFTPRPQYEAYGAGIAALQRGDYEQAAEYMRQVLDLDFPLLSDWNGDAVRGLGVGHEYRGMQDVPTRSVFLVGRDGIIRGAWRYASSEVPDFDELLEAARSLS